MARKMEVTTVLMEDMRERQIDKHYLARVRGEFPVYVFCATPERSAIFVCICNNLIPLDEFVFFFLSTNEGRFGVGF